MSEFWDRLGISTSLLCIVHCLATPFLVLLVPFAGEFMEHRWFHLIIAIVVLPVAAIALARGYRLHQKKSTLWWGAIGIAFVGIALIFGERDQKIFEFCCMMIGGAGLITAHYLNLKECRHHHHPAEAPTRSPRRHDHSTDARGARKALDNREP